MPVEKGALPAASDDYSSGPTLSQLVRGAGLMQISTATPGFGYSTLGGFTMWAAAELGKNMLERVQGKIPQKKMIIVFGGEPLSGKTWIRSLVDYVLDRYVTVNLSGLGSKMTKIERVTWENNGLFKAMPQDPGAVPTPATLRLANEFLGDAFEQTFWRSNVAIMEAPLITGVPLDQGWIGQPRGSELVRQMVRRKGRFDLEEKYRYDTWLVMIRGGPDFRTSMGYYRELMKRAENLAEMRAVAARYGKSPRYPYNIYQGRSEQRQGATLEQVRNIEEVVNDLIRRLIRLGKLNLPEDIDLSPDHLHRVRAVDELTRYFCQQIGIPPTRLFIGANEPTLSELGVDPRVIREDKQMLEPDN